MNDENVYKKNTLIQVSILLPWATLEQRGKPVRKVAALTPTMLHGVHLFL